MPLDSTPRALVQMPYLATPDAPALPLIAQPILRAGDERSPLRPGVHALGGRAPDAIKLAALESQPRAAILTVSADGTTVLQRTTASVMVRIDGETIGIAAVELCHGATIEFGDCRLVFETDAAPATNVGRRMGERTSSGATTTGARSLSLVSARAGLGAEAQAPTDPNANSVTNAALVVSRSGVRHPLPARRIYIGRDDTCDVVVRGNSVSRRHASIAPVIGGFMLRDESVNGTMVNGVRVVGTYLLGSGDVVRIQDEELVVELDASAPRSTVREVQTTRLDLSHIVPGVTEERAREMANRVPTASLEIVRGPFSGACFQIERAVCSIGRGEDNDVRIRDDTISLTHATLLRKRGAWFVVDLRSMNGTYVDGSRVSGERELCPGARVRLGAVELVFRAIDADVLPPAEPPRISLWKKLRGLIRSVTPPS
ncbi:MAG: FHA domain-containing protein [Gemmatimonadaceae bacterium]